MESNQELDLLRKKCQELQEEIKKSNKERDDFLLIVGIARVTAFDNGHTATYKKIDSLLGLSNSGKSISDVADQILNARSQQSRTS